MRNNYAENPNPKPKNYINYQSLDFGRLTQNHEKLSIEEINKMKRQEIEREFQEENLRQMEEKAKKKDYDKQMKILEQEFEAKKFINEKKSKNLQEANFLATKNKNFDFLKTQHGDTPVVNEEIEQNMQNIFGKEVKKLRNHLFFQQNVLTEQILGIKVCFFFLKI